MTARQTERVLERAARLLARVEAMGTEIARVLCTPSVRRAARRIQRAGKLIDEAVGIAQRLALRQLQFDKSPDILFSRSFVGRESWLALRDLQYSYLVGSRSLRGTVELPTRGELRRELVLGPRRALRRYARVARLPNDSPLLLAMRVSLKPRAGVERRQSRKGKRS